jgi:hypothetical protein
MIDRSWALPWSPVVAKPDRSERPTSGSFDYTTAPNAGGLFLGDYAGLSASGSTFPAFFGMSKPIATTGRSDIFSNSAG